jgi:alpha-L-arabinofuranosidase
MVVNRLPTEAVTATLLVEGHLGGAAEVRTVAGDSFASSNKPGQEPEVTMTVAETSISPEGVTHTFPAASTTVLTLPPAP